MRGLAVLVLFLPLAACAAERSTPREAFDAMRAALAARDPRALDELTDSDSVAYRRADVRERRALLDRGDDPDAVLQGIPLTVDEIRRGTEEDAARLLLEKRSPLFEPATAAWYAAASVLSETPEGEDAVHLRIRGPDGREEDLWFLREGGKWNYDQFRTRRTW